MRASSLASFRYRTDSPFCWDSNSLYERKSINCIVLELIRLGNAGSKQCMVGSNHFLRRSDENSFSVPFSEPPLAHQFSVS